MRCKEFEENHCLFIDEKLAGVQADRMCRHLSECCRCAERDAKVRRSLMAVHSLLPRVEPSSDFAKRLEAKLKACRDEPDNTYCANFRAIAAAGAVASIVMLGYMANSLPKEAATPARDIVLPPVIAMAEPPDADVDLVASQPAAQVIIASVSAGMPLLPAALFADQAPLHFAKYSRVH